jgi:SAM-dependent methyltransferase
MDSPSANPDLVVRSLDDVVVANRLFGGSRAVLRELHRVFQDSHAKELSLLDVGTGLGDIPAAARNFGRGIGVDINTVGVDASEASLRARTDSAMQPVLADGLTLPFPNAAFDVVICSQVLHHFAGSSAGRLLRELNRVARMRVIVADIRRSWFAAVGIWLASFPLRFHPVSRHDGVVSVMRGFTVAELGAMVRDETGVEARIRKHAAFRITASWNPSATDFP